jgi:hypothetical protein
MQTILTLKWETHGEHAEHLVSQAAEHLDKRKKHLKDDDLNRDILTAILAQRGGPFEVRYTQLPKNVREAVRGAVECLCGPVLLSLPGTTTYALKDDWRPPEARFITKENNPSGKRRGSVVKTKFGTVYRDGSHDEVPFENISLLGYFKPCLLTIVAPHHHWQIFTGEMPPPSKNWKELEEVEQAFPRHDELMELIVMTALYRGIDVVRYGEASFITNNVDAVANILDITLIRFTGRAGQRAVLTGKDIYGRTFHRWGGKE